MLGDVAGIVNIFNALLFELVVKLGTMNLEVLVRHFGVENGQSVDPHSPTPVFIFDGVMKQNPEDGEHHVSHFLLLGILTYENEIVRVSVRE